MASIATFIGTAYISAKLRNSTAEKSTNFQVHDLRHIAVHDILNGLQVSLLLYMHLQWQI